MTLGLSKGSNKVGMSLPSPEYGNTSGSRNFVISNELEFRAVDKAHKPRNPGNYRTALACWCSAEGWRSVNCNRSWSVTLPILYRKWKYEYLTTCGISFCFNSLAVCSGVTEESLYKQAPFNHKIYLTGSKCVRPVFWTLGLLVRR